jgi:hypothetical protein
LFILYTLTSFAVLLVILRHGYTTCYFHLCKYQIILTGLLELALALQAPPTACICQNLKAKACLVVSLSFLAVDLEVIWRQFLGL